MALVMVKQVGKDWQGLKVYHIHRCDDGGIFFELLRARGNHDRRYLARGRVQPRRGTR